MVTWTAFADIGDAVPVAATANPPPPPAGLWAGPGLSPGLDGLQVAGTLPLAVEVVICTTFNYRLASYWRSGLLGITR